MCSSVADIIQLKTIADYWKPFQRFMCYFLRTLIFLKANTLLTELRFLQRQFKSLVPSAAAKSAKYQAL